MWKKKPDGTEEIYFYGLGGPKLGAYRFLGGALTAVTTNLYFAGKTIRAQGQAVVTDRLGSVRYAGGTTSRYFPYGQEQVVSSQEREKFGTYYRDGTTGLDYADQRYYGNTTARFLSPDPYEASGGSSDPGSWNRYAYVSNDPANYSDPRGLEECQFVNGVCQVKDKLPRPDDQAWQEMVYEWLMTNVCRHRRREAGKSELGARSANERRTCSKGEGGVLRQDT